MIFGFDLDRTLIFSKNALGETYNKSLYICIETKKVTEQISGSKKKKVSEKEISYIHRKVLSTIDEVNVFRNVYFVPVTTRSLAQFKRVDFFNEMEYAICANGGIILHNGRKLRGWNTIIQGLLVEVNEAYEKIIKCLESFDYVTRKPEIVDGIFVFCKTEHPDKVSVYLDSLLEGTKCTYTIQGEKVYIMHKGISKENALKYLCKRVKNDRLIVAGDGKLDKGMLMLSNDAYTLAESEVLKYMKPEEKKKVKVTERLGNGSLEIVKHVKKVILSHPEYCVLK